jgi:imidazolonepropionase-like amidohydrolase
MNLILKTILLSWFAATVLLSQTIVIRTTTVLDGKGQILKNKDIVVEGIKIKAIVNGAGKATYDLSGMTVMPGWIDTHVHLGWHFNKENRLDQGGRGSKETPQETALYAAANAYATLMGGFTTVQSLGAPIDADIRYLDQTGQLAGPRVLTSFRQLNETSGTPEQIRALVRKTKEDGADVIKLFATKSIRDGGGQTMTDEQLQAACGEAKAVGLRAVVHAHATGGAKAAILAGCTGIEHGTFLDDATLQLMADRGIYFDPNFLVLHNYLENKPKFLGIGNYNEEGFAYMEKALPQVSDVLQRAMKHHVKIVLGTDAVAGAHGRNAEEFIYRVNDGKQSPMDAIVSGTSVWPNRWGWGIRSGRLPRGSKRISSPWKVIR